MNHNVLPHGLQVKHLKMLSSQVAALVKLFNGKEALLSRPIQTVKVQSTVFALESTKLLVVKSFLLEEMTRLLLFINSLETNSPNFGKLPLMLLQDLLICSMETSFLV